MFFILRSNLFWIKPAKVPHRPKDYVSLSLCHFLSLCLSFSYPSHLSLSYPTTERLILRTILSEINYRPSQWIRKNKTFLALFTSIKNSKRNASGGLRIFFWLVGLPRFSISKQSNIDAHCASQFSQRYHPLINWEFSERFSIFDFSVNKIRNVCIGWFSWAASMNERRRFVFFVGAIVSSSRSSSSHRRRYSRWLDECARTNRIYIFIVDRVMCAMA